MTRFEYTAPRVRLQASTMEQTQVSTTMTIHHAHCEYSSNKIIDFRMPVQNKAASDYDHCYQNGEKIVPLDLEELGYRLTARFVVVDDQYKLFELLPSESSRPARKCFLASDNRSHGVIVNGTFNEHKVISNSSKLNPQSTVESKRLVLKMPAAVMIAKPRESFRQTVTSADPRYYVFDV